MSLATGDRLGSYDILAPLGAGGMGAVYRARDTKLKREVAIKVLLASVAADPDRIARFEREAIALAALHHPHIASLFGMEESGGQHYLVMELVDGPTLAERLNGCALSHEEAIAIARQLADALEAAHERGIVHRDLKPANIKITSDGTVKVLDFGLAAVSDAVTSPAGNQTHSPTLSLHATQAGVLLGTAAYMSPEQASGKVVDKRTDIWAFGVVLWEMLTGKQLFEGETLSHTLADVLRAPIDVNALPASTPRHVRDLLQRCLERDVKRRLRDIGEARIALEIAERNAPASEADATDGDAAHRGVAWLPWTLVAVLSLAVAVLAIAWIRRAVPVEPAVLTVDISPPPDSFSGSRPVISPDGRTLAAQARVSGLAGTRLFVRPLDSLKWRELPGTIDAFGPSWSPDGRSLSFVTLPGKLRRIDVASGLTQTLCDSPPGFIPFTAWSREDVILFSGLDGLRKVSATGGTPSPVTALDPTQQENLHGIPQFLPDGRHFLYWARSGTPEKSAVLVGSLDAAPGVGNRKHILGGSINAFFASEPGGRGGHLLFEREGGLVAQPFDLSALAVIGSAFPVLPQVGRQNDLLGVSASETGVLVYSAETMGPGERQIAWFDRDGKPLGDVGPPGFYNESSLSPDGRRLAVSRRDSNQDDIWLLTVEPQIGFTRLTFDPGRDRAPAWSPDGTRVAFASQREAGAGLYVKSIGGVSPERLIMKSTSDPYPTDWSPDQKSILYTAQGDLWAATDGEASRITKTEAVETQAQFSPDGRWIAYASSESTRREVYVMSYPDRGSKWLVSSSGGSSPRWRRDGKELFYLSLDSRLMAVPVKSDRNSFEPAPPQALFQTRLQGTNAQGFHYSVSADGQRFIIDGIQAIGSRPVTVVTNWLVAVKR